MSGKPTKLELIAQTPPGPVLVHCDLMRARHFVGAITSRLAMLQQQKEVLLDACGERPFWTPCFNYDFCGSGAVDLRSAKCQVGPMGEYIRNQEGFFRSSDPVFSILGNGPVIDEASADIVPAFSSESGLGQLYCRDGSVLFFGAAISSATILHLAESMSGGPVYRYDKTFSGEMTTACGVTRQIGYIYHVRPMGMSLDYDWQRIESDLLDAGILRQQLVGKEVVAMLADARPLVDFWIEKLQIDPLYLLDPPTREKVISIGLPPGRRVQQSDYEPSA